MNKNMRNMALYIGMILIGIIIGGNIVGYIMSGVVTLLTFVFLVENSDTLKKICYSCNKLIDILIFGFGIYAKVKLGVTIGMAVMFAGLGYSMIYGPYVHATYANIKSKK